MACHQAARAAVSLGYKNVFVMPEGSEGWEKSGRKMEKGS